MPSQSLINSSNPLSKSDPSFSKSEQASPHRWCFQASVAVVDCGRTSVIFSGSRITPDQNCVFHRQRDDSTLSPTRTGICKRDLQHYLLLELPPFVSDSFGKCHRSQCHRFLMKLNNETVSIELKNGTVSAHVCIACNLSLKTCTAYSCKFVSCSCLIPQTRIEIRVVFVFGPCRVRTRIEIRVVFVFAKFVSCKFVSDTNTRHDDTNCQHKKQNTHFFRQKYAHMKV
ncbi:hypothetical protein LXL04_023680 [Taraxacum kok-saghyz]